jgi:hypothetical protein
MQMHQLAMSRVKLYRLRRRALKLKSSMARARADGSWSPDRAASAEQDLQALQAAIKAAEGETARRQAAIDAAGGR